MDFLCSFGMADFVLESLRRQAPIKASMRSHINLRFLRRKKQHKKKTFQHSLNSECLSLFILLWLRQIKRDTVFPVHMNVAEKKTLALTPRLTNAIFSRKSLLSAHLIDHTHTANRTRARAYRHFLTNFSRVMVMAYPPVDLHHKINRKIKFVNSPPDRTVNDLFYFRCGWMQFPHQTANTYWSFVVVNYARWAHTNNSRNLYNCIRIVLGDLQLFASSFNK